MKRIIALVILIVFFKACFCQTEEDLKTHIQYLTSFDLKGRVVGSEGGKLAAAYIAEQFKKNNLKPYISNSYFQNFHLYKNLGATSGIYINDKKVPFAYYGTEIKRNDSSNFNIILPQNINKKTSTNNCILLQPENLEEGIRTVKQIHQNFGTKNFLLAFQPRSKSIKVYTNVRVPVKSKNYYEVYYYAKNFIQTKDYGTEYYLTKSSAGKFGYNENSFKNFNLYITSTHIIDTTLNKNCGTKNKLTISRKQVIKDSIEVQNVIAKIQGVNPDKGAIVVCAHYDHVAPLPHEYKKYSEIPDSLLYMPGADDNASGTAAVIEIAKQLSFRNIKPERTIYFCLFDGEEAGFYGSTAFRKQFNDSISLVINFDMVGRNKYDWTINNKKVFGKAEGENANAILTAFKKQIRTNDNLKLDKSMIKDGWKNGSDHVVFRKQSEIMYFFTGNHKDYHTPNDTENKINYTKLNAFCMEFAELLSTINF